MTSDLIDAYVEAYRRRDEATMDTIIATLLKLKELTVVNLIISRQLL